ncbi:MAG: response regulator, partial [Flavisolibacter sp.]
MSTYKSNTSVSVIQLLIVDDHKMVRDGLKVMLSSLKKMMQFNIDEAENGEEAIRKASQKQYDIIIVDYHMPGLAGPEAVIRLIRYRPQAKILALSNYDEVQYVQSMIDAGAKGYVLKNIEPAQLLTAIKTILDNKMYYSNEVATKLIEVVKKDPIKSLWTEEGLTRRELEILRMIAMEMTNDEISKKLNIGKRTVDSHRQNLLNKLHAKNTVGLIKAAYK